MKSKNLDFIAIILYTNQVDFTKKLALPKPYRRENVMNEKELNLNEEYEDEIVTLAGPDGEEIDFVVIAEIPLGEKYYEILQPEKLFDGMEEDEALVFEVIDNGDGTAKYNFVEDDEVIDAVFAEYEKAVEEN